jgi:hypothetical protein
VLLEDVKRIAQCGLARMQEVLPSYAKVPAEKLISVTLTITRHLLEAIRDAGLIQPVPKITFGWRERSA